MKTARKDCKMSSSHWFGKSQQLIQISKYEAPYIFFHYLTVLIYGSAEPWRTPDPTADPFSLKKHGLFWMFFGK